MPRPPPAAVVCVVEEFALVDVDHLRPKGVFVDTTSSVRVVDDVLETHLQDFNTISEE